MADALRRFLQTVSPDLSRQAEGASNKEVLEPTTFIQAWAGVNEPDQYRRSFLGVPSNAEKPQTLSAVSDDDGRIFMPGLGFVTGLATNNTHLLVRDSSSPFGYGVGQQQPGYTVLESASLHRGSPMLLPFPIPSIEAAIEQELNQGLGLASISLEQRRQLLMAYEAIQQTWPELASMINSHCYYIWFFHQESLNSFASKLAPGVLFFNLAVKPSFAGFIEDIVHQATHVAFHAAWHDAQPIWPGLEDSRLQDWTTDPDHRTLEDAVHGMVTLALIVEILSRVSLRPDYGEHKLEIEGRLLYALVKLGLDVHRLPQLPVFTENGKLLLYELCTVYNESLPIYQQALQTVNFSGQTYNFNHAIFMRYNQHQHQESTP